MALLVLRRDTLRIIDGAVPAVDFFFFQAEDGIRDVAVTGVQTCALPIYGVQAPLLAQPDGAAGASLLVTRTQHEQRGFEIHPGQDVAIGVRRPPVLPTPPSTFPPLAPSPPPAATPRRHPPPPAPGRRLETP